MKKTRTPAEIQACITDLKSRMAHQPALRGFADQPRLDTGVCTSPSCSNRRCSCSQKSAR